MHACHRHRYRSSLVPLSGTGKKSGGGSKGDRLTGGYKGVRAVRPESVAGGGCFEVLWNLECPVGLSQKRIYAHFNEGNLAKYLPKNKELWSYVVIFEFSRPKVAHIGLILYLNNA